MTNEAIAIKPRPKIPEIRGPESKIFRKVKEVGKEAKKRLTEAGKAWFDRLREKAQEEPREVIEEVQKAPELEKELTELITDDKEEIPSEGKAGQGLQVEASEQRDPDKDVSVIKEEVDGSEVEKDSLGIEEQQIPIKSEQSEGEKKSLFEIERQENGEFITEPTLDLKEAIEEGEVTSVFQKGIGFINGNDPKTRFLETSDFGGKKPFFGSCVMVAGWGQESKTVGLFHADTLTDIDQAVELLDKKFGTDEIVELSIVGGQTGASENILLKINEKLASLVEKREWVLKRLDVLGLKGIAVRQVVVDAQDGKVFNLQGDQRTQVHPWGISTEMPEEMKIRQLRAASVNKGLIIDSDF
ncbi:hypothetical protein ISS85_02455 [Candidatus Microgenomates bacterium]|nr:hypothetical protein [Candidatus Microgenomates bacterium]